MADFALWATACESAFWPVGTFWAAYRGNRDEAVDGVIDADSISNTVRAVMTTRTVWKGTATELLVVLAGAAGERAAKSKAWPDNPRALAGRLRRAATFLRKIGIEVTFSREGRTKTRMIQIVVKRGISTAEDGGTQSSAPIAPSVSVADTDDNRGITASPLGRVANGADSSADSGNHIGTLSVRANALKNSSAVVAYGTDANSPHQFPAGIMSAPGWKGRL
jgi:hypothetical protein